MSDFPTDLLETYPQSISVKFLCILSGSSFLCESHVLSVHRPQGAGEQEWELSENPADEGIQPDIHSGNQGSQFASCFSNAYHPSPVGPSNLGNSGTAVR